MKILFMGTPDFAVPCLEKLIESDHDVIAVFTQPDKPVGRKQILTPPAVKVCALEHNIPVYQPQCVKDADVINTINELNPDIIIVVAYGKILPIEILNAPQYGCINVHASILPKYRGAAPIQWAVLNGDKITGVSIMKMDEGLDTGDVMLVKETEIGINETSEELFERLSVIGADALIEALDLIKSSKAEFKKQPDGDYQYASLITRDLCEIDWYKSAAEIHNKVRGLQTWPVAVTRINGKNIKIHKTVLTDIKSNKTAQIVDNNNRLIVCCGDGNCLEILELQMEGKKRMSVKPFLQGNKIELNTILGE